MGFRTYAQTVRDERLPPHRRRHALRCAVERYRPLGFHPTWAYVTAEGDGPVRALDVLEESRHVWLRDVAVFAGIRRAEKAAGRRTPREGQTARVPVVPDGREGPVWPGEGPPSRLGLVAAVADGHTALRRVAAHGAALRTPRHTALHRALDACAAEWTATLGLPGPEAREALRALLRELEDAPRVDTLRWLRFARLLDYAATAPRPRRPPGGRAP